MSRLSVKIEPGYLTAAVNKQQYWYTEVIVITGVAVLGAVVLVPAAADIVSGREVSQEMHYTLHSHPSLDVWWWAHMERQEIEFDVCIKITDGLRVMNLSLRHVSKGIRHKPECVEGLNQELAGWSTVAPESCITA